MAPRPRAPCQLCEAATSKYACPRCGILYCSVPCYKEHKAKSCGESSAAPVASAPSLFVSDGSPSESNELPHGDLEAGPSSSSMPSNSADADEDASATNDTNMKAGSEANEDGAPAREPAPPLRSLTSLKWPYVPEPRAYPDPLERDDPQPLSLAQYEAIATSPTIRTALHAHPRLPTLLRALDALRGRAREETLERVLGVSHGDAAAFSLNALAGPGGGPAGDSEVLAQEIAIGPAAGTGTGTGTGGNEMGSAPEAIVHADAEDLRALRALAAAIEAAVRSQGPRPDALGLDWDAER